MGFVRELVELINKYLGDSERNSCKEDERRTRKEIDEEIEN